MKYFMYSKCGEGAQVLYRIMCEGNDVRLFIKEKEYRRNWEGLLSKAIPSSSFIDQDTIILFDFSGMGDIADELRKSGHKVFGASSFADKLEEDRKFGLEFMTKCGIKHAKSHEFCVDELEEAKAYIAGRNNKLVFKPSGESLPCHLTYCSEDEEDLIRYIDYVYRYYEQDIDTFVLQDFVEGDIISSELFFDGKKAVWPANHTIEAKKFLSGDLGPSSGCAGNLVWAEYDDCSIVEEGIGKVEEELVKMQFCGQLDLNAIVNDEGLFGLEWTPRFGYDSIPSIIPLIQDDLGSFFYKMATGVGTMTMSDSFSAGVRFSIPPYPIEPEHLHFVLKESPNLGIPIRGFDVDDLCNLYFFEVMLDDDDNLVHADGTGVLGVAGGLGLNPKDAFANAYEVLERAKVPDLQYRNDLGKVIAKMYNEIEEREAKNARY